ncbi:hypothetical protein NBRC10512_001911 [Rhodotorula toruloides]|uniref:RHTO0S02e06106g1_1 n=2 Tax=Rhodotorula toruloides TaxID=5286 RepID=A0A061AHX0_RHOTO|nr:uncharacterized protein RHTO_01100 [Rhodotorula toruloides NP11]EMS21886.1 hypothetical protein RHTO_01100 [Rhodotorula toruloides NP11]CDR36724.1 RHTO0S02e06106g1_1 [Rhodotorula toruloides]
MSLPARSSSPERPPSPASDEDDSDIEFEEVILPAYEARATVDDPDPDPDLAIAERLLEVADNAPPGSAVPATLGGGNGLASADDAAQGRRDRAGQAGESLESFPRLADFTVGTNRQRENAFVRSTRTTLRSLIDQVARRVVVHPDSAASSASVGPSVRPFAAFLPVKKKSRGKKRRPTLEKVSGREGKRRRVGDSGTGDATGAQHVGEEEEDPRDAGDEDDDNYEPVDDDDDEDEDDDYDPDDDTDTTHTSTDCPVGDDVRAYAALQIVIANLERLRQGRPSRFVVAGSPSPLLPPNNQILCRPLHDSQPSTSTTPTEITSSSSLLAASMVVNKKYHLFDNYTFFSLFSVFLLTPTFASDLFTFLSSASPDHPFRIKINLIGRVEDTVQSKDGHRNVDLDRLASFGRNARTAAVHVRVKSRADGVLGDLRATVYYRASVQPREKLEQLLLDAGWTGEGWKKRVAPAEQRKVQRWIDALQDEIDSTFDRDLPAVPAGASLSGPTSPSSSTSVGGSTGGSTSPSSALFSYPPSVNDVCKYWHLDPSGRPLPPLPSPSKQYNLWREGGVCDSLWTANASDPATQSLIQPQLCTFPLPSSDFPDFQLHVGAFSTLEAAQQAVVALLEEKNLLDHSFPPSALGRMTTNVPRGVGRASRFGRHKTSGAEHTILASMHAVINNAGSSAPAPPSVPSSSPPLPAPATVASSASAVSVESVKPSAIGPYVAQVYTSSAGHLEVGIQETPLFDLEGWHRTSAVGVLFPWYRFATKPAPDQLENMSKGHAGGSSKGSRSNRGQFVDRESSFTEKLLMIRGAGREVHLCLNIQQSSHAYGSPPSTWYSWHLDLPSCAAVPSKSMWLRTSSPIHKALIAMVNPGSDPSAPTIKVPFNLRQKSNDLLIQRIRPTSEQDDGKPPPRQLSLLDPTNFTTTSVKKACQFLLECDDFCEQTAVSRVNPVLTVEESELLKNVIEETPPARLAYDMYQAQRSKPGGMRKGLPVTFAGGFVNIYADPQIGFKRVLVAARQNDVPSILSLPNPPPPASLCFLSLSPQNQILVWRPPMPQPVPLSRLGTLAPALADTVRTAIRAALRTARSPRAALSSRKADLEQGGGGEGRGGGGAEAREGGSAHAGMELQE